MAGIVDYRTFLQQARAEVQNLQALEARRDQALLDKRQSGRVLENEKKALEEDIRLTTKTRRDEAAAVYDKQIAEKEEKLRGVKSSRDDARGQGVKARIDAETAGLRKSPARSVQIPDTIRANPRHGLDNLSAR